MRDTLKDFLLKIITWQAKMILKKYQPKIIAVSGSVGKTSTKDAIYAALKDSFHTRKSQKSFNSDFGVPLTILGVPNGWYDPLQWLRNIAAGFWMLIKREKYPELLILEVGADHPGDIDALTNWLTPSMVVLTRFPDTPVHIEFFESAEALYQEDLRIADALPEDGTLIANADDERIMEYVESKKFTTMRYGYSTEAEVRGSGLQLRYHDKKVRGTAFRVRSKEHSAELLTIEGVLGKVHTYPLLAAISVGLSLGIAFEELLKSLATHTPPLGRMHILPGLKDSVLIDDTYNSSPAAVEEALTTLKEIDTTGRKIVVLGDMLELGVHSVEAHRKVGEQVASIADILVTVGIRARIIATTAHEHGLDRERIFMFDECAPAGNEIERRLSERDVVLIKASQALRFERIVEELMAEPLKKAELLVRQDSAWLLKK